MGIKQSKRNKNFLDEKSLRKLYMEEGKSIKEISKILNCSVHKISYWMLKYNINTRSISEAVYLKNNPNGDPFIFNKPKTINDSWLLGMGLGLYWGEGTKADKVSVRLGNTDPELVSTFIQFLVKIFGIHRKDLKFGLQLFNDVSVGEALDFWQKKLKIDKSQFYKTVVTKSRAKGTYRKKSKYGVLTVYYHNRKLRDLLVNMLPRTA